MRRLLWVGDAVVASGFAKATHKTLEAFHKSGEWDVVVCGINYYGDPHEYPYPIFPANPGGHDAYGVHRTAQLVGALQPDVVIIQQDPWNFAEYLKRIGGSTPVIGAVAVDGKNCRGNELNGLSHAIFWTEFGQFEAKRGGFTGTSSVIPLGVDLDIYRPVMQAEARWRADFPDAIRDRFIVGNVNRNQPRKRHDLTISYFAEWVKEYGIKDAMLYFHICPTGEDAYDAKQLVKYYGMKGQFIISDPDNIGYGLPERSMPTVYSCSDVMFSTTQGEGWGLPHIESMACGVPQIAPDWSALAEWTVNKQGEDCAYLVPCTSIACTTSGVNTIGGIMDREAGIRALDTMYRDHEILMRYKQRGLALVEEDRFRWENIGARFLEVTDAVLSSPSAKLPEGDRVVRQ